MTTRFYFLGKIIREVIADALTPAEIEAQVKNIAELNEIPEASIYWEEVKE